MSAGVSQPRPILFSDFKNALRQSFHAQQAKPLSFPTQYDRSIEDQLNQIGNDILASYKFIAEYQSANPSPLTPNYVGKIKLYGDDTPKEQRRVSLDISETGTWRIVVKSVRPFLGKFHKVYPAVEWNPDKNLDDLTVSAWSKSMTEKDKAKYNALIAFARSKSAAEKSMEPHELSVPVESKPITSAHNEKEAETIRVNHFNHVMWLKKLNGKPGILNLLSSQSYPSSKDPGFFRYSTVTEYCPQNLLNAIETPGFRTLENADNLIRIMKELIELMVLLEDQNIHHKDIKLENLLLTHLMRLILIDFEFTRDLMEEKKEPGDFSGSRSYVSPEYVLGHLEIDKIKRNSSLTESQKSQHIQQEATKFATSAADIWSSGNVLFVILTSILPFKFEAHDLSSLLHYFNTPRKTDERIKNLLKNYDPETNPITILLENMLKEDPLARWKASQCNTHLAKYSDEELKDALKIFLTPKEPTKVIIAAVP